MHLATVKQRHIVNRGKDFGNKSNTHIPYIRHLCGHSRDTLPFKAPLNGKVCVLKWQNMCTAPTVQRYSERLG